MGGMFDFAVLAIGRADEADRITAVALNFEMKGKRFAFNGHQMSLLTSQNQTKHTTCMATNEMPNGCGSSIEAVLASNQKRRRVKTIIKNNVQTRTIWSSTPRPTAKNQSAGAGVPVGRRKRACLAAKRGSSNIQSRWRRSNTRKTTAVTAP